MLKNLLVYLGIIVLYTLILFGWIGHQDFSVTTMMSFFIGGPIIATFIYHLLSLPFSPVIKTVLSLVIILVSTLITYKLEPILQPLVYHLTNDIELAAFSIYVVFTVLNLSFGGLSIFLKKTFSVK